MPVLVPPVLVPPVLPVLVPPVPPVLVLPVLVPPVSNPPTPAVITPPPALQHQSSAPWVSRMRNADCWILPPTLNGISTALIDTGASCSVLSRAIFQAFSATKYPLKEIEPSFIRGVGDTKLPCLGEVHVNVSLGSHRYPIDMLVSSEKEFVGCYLGQDFFRAHDCEFSIRDGWFDIGKRRYKMIKDKHLYTCARVRVKEDIVLDSHSETVITGVAQALVK